MTSNSKPALSVIIASYNAEDTVVACLESLERQKTTESYEVILVDSSTDGTAELVQTGFPAVRLHRSSERMYCGDARNMGISVARADIIAFLDSDCTVGENWVEQILAAHRGEYLTVGGAIENGNEESALSWAYYFCEFNLWLPFRKKKEASEIAGCTLSMKRRAFDLYGPFPEGTYSSDTSFFRRLRRDNHRALLVPSIRVYHSAHHSLKTFLSHIFFHRRDFARVMVRDGRMSSVKRALFASLTPLLPFALFLVVSVRVLKSRSFRYEFLRTAPLVFAGFVARACGEYAGLVSEV